MLPHSPAISLRTSSTTGRRLSLATRAEVPLRRDGVAAPSRLVGRLLLPLALGGCQAPMADGGSGAALEGRVVDLQGRPLRGVSITVNQRRTRTGGDGGFRLRLPAHPAWLEAQAVGYLRLLRPVVTGRPLLLRLSPDDGQTLVIRAAGDVMAGRRFDTSRSAPSAPGLPTIPNMSVGHARLLAPIQQLLSQADLTLVNLDTPLLSDPLALRRRQRSRDSEPTHDSSFTSAPGLAVALRQVGVDVVGLANDHVYDALEPGVQSTLASLQGAGFFQDVGYFGAGSTMAQAWRPAVQRRHGAVVSSLGCTTVSSRHDPISSVASAVQAKGGAAFCEPERLVASIRSARRHGPVIVMIHGGHRGQADPTPAITSLVELARRSGASLILNHHPHVIGGFRWDGRSLVADSLGNLLSEQTLWSTFPSLLLEVQLRQGQIARLIGYPLLLQGSRPHLAVGDLADWILASAAFRQPGPWLINGGLLEADLTGQAVTHRRWSVLQRPSLALPEAQPRLLWQLPVGVQVCGRRGTSTLELGRDLIGVGRFEQELLGSDAVAGPAALWRLGHRDRALSTEAAHQGRFGVRLQRRASQQQPVLLQPLHRLPVRPGQRLTMLAWVRGSIGAQPRLQLSWFDGRRGHSQARLVREVPLLRPQQWQPVRLDVVVPAHTVAVGPAIRLDPPLSGRVSLDLDDVALVHWQDSARGQREGSGWLRSAPAGAVCLGRAALPGAPRTDSSLALAPWPQPPAKRMSRLRR